MGLTTTVSSGRNREWIRGGTSQFPVQVDWQAAPHSYLLILGSSREEHAETA